MGNPVRDPRGDEAGTDLLPHRWKWLVGLFSRYAFRYVRRSFHAVRLAHEGRPLGFADMPVIVYMNHPSWWDPLVCIVLAETLLPDRRHYAPMDATALKHYRFFSRLGFFGVEPGGIAGARAFLNTAGEILRHEESVLWITPQGRFADPRSRPVRFRSGLGHLAQRAERCALLPIALEYPFWEERFPEALARCGVVTYTSETRAFDPAAWSKLLEGRLEDAQDALATDSMNRNQNAFDTLLSGRAGVGGAYDLWRSFKAKLRGEAFRAEHGERRP
jgi:1-acyl-sn-glycerol-3-phosphate acyltransferase